MLVCDRVGVLQAHETLLKEVAPEARDATRAIITVLYDAGLVNMSSKCYIVVAMQSLSLMPRISASSTPALTREMKAAQCA